MYTKTLCLVLWLVTALRVISGSKLDLLGATFKKRVHEVKNWPQIDLIFLVDGSSSVGEENFLSEIRFVRKLLSDLTVSKEHTRVAVVTFGSQDSVVLHVDDITNDGETTDKCTLLNDVLPNIRYAGGGTYTLGAFLAARRIVLDSVRNGTRKAVFLVTDGFSNGGDPQPIADLLKFEHNVTVFTIGIKTGRGDELKTLATNNETCYLLQDFKEFESLARRALHADLQDGEYVPVPVAKCDGMCDAKLADCTCGTASGQYACKCRRGYYGTGEQCQPCPRGTWHRKRDGICVPCPDPNHESFMALTVNDCKCKRGYNDNGLGRCEVVKCPEITAPANGYFVGVPAKAGKCPNVLHNACGVRCQVGYYLRGNSIRLCQANGTWTGVKPQCEVKTCTKPPVPLKGKVVECINKDTDTKYEGSRLPDDMPVDTECTFGCGEGHSVTGSTLRTCLPVAQWDGLKTTCKPIRCNRLGKIAHGHWIPEGCSKDRQKFGARCTLVCKPGFVASGDAIICRATAGRGVGKWNASAIKCIDREPPVIKCPAESVQVETVAGSQFGVAKWESPQVTDNSGGLDVTVWLEPGEQDEHAWNEFEIGSTVITYHAVDSFGNEATCNMTVVVVDKEAPVIENCESPPPFLTGDPTKVSVQWDEPLAYDNSKGPVEMRKSHEFGIFESGTTEVTYTATDTYNNTNTCTIHITVVAEATCENPPSETAICTPTHEGVTCALTCQEGYGFALTDRAVCLHDAPGIWDVPECTPTETPIDVWEVVNAEAECADNQAVETLGSIVREDGGIILLSGCQRQRKRNSDDAKHMRRMEFHVKNTNKILQGADKVGVSVRLGEPLVSCKNGSVPAVRKASQKVQCVKCPRGTYFIDKQCIPCPPDTFANKPGSLTCEPCAVGRSTMGKTRAKAKRACKVQCPTGTSKSVKGNTCEGRRPTKRLSCERSNVCKNGGTCIPVGTYRQKCVCTATWTGARCRVRVKVCLCQNGGSCTDAGKCTCPSGFVGEYCELPESDLLPVPVEEDKPEELSNPCRMVDGLCQNNGTCTVTPTGGYVCECVDGYIGRRCNVLPCDYSPCPLSSICVNVAEANATRNSYKCECPEGRYNPPECNSLSDNCHSNPCLNGATCVSQTDGFHCQCAETFDGVRCEIENDPDYVLHFPRSGINDFVIVDGPATNLSQVSMCGWLQTADKGNYGTVLSYATDVHDNAFTVTDYSGLVLYVNGRHVVTDVKLNDGRWHHLCVTWNMSKGAYSVYVDSKLETSGQGLSDGIVISGHGKIVLGQEQDTLGGTFSRAESFIGKLSYVDIWSKVLTDSEVTATMHGCTAANIGNIRTWADFRNGTRGFVHVENSTFCGNCSSPNPIPNGQLLQVAVDGRTATYQCNAGYDLFFEGNEVLGGTLNRQCTAASLWEGSRDPICVPVICPYPGYVPHARITGIYHNYRFNDQLTYRCLPGFEPSDPQVRTCTENGTWSGTRPICRGGQCLPFAKPTNSNVTVVSEHVYEEESFEDIVLFEIGTQLEILCAAGEELQGAKLLSCQENGTWDHDIPKCQSQSQSPGCLANEMPSIPTNGYTLNEISGVSFDTGTVIAFKCRNGHRPVGVNFTECLDNGRWTALSLVCKPIECVTPPAYSNMHYKNGYNITEYFFGNMVKYECNEGHVFYGNNVARCLANGKWTKVKGQCTRISCKKPNVGADETVIGNSYLYKDSLTVQCPKGSGNTEYMMKCTSTGKWLQIGDCQNAAQDPEDI